MIAKISDTSNFIFVGTGVIVLNSHGNVLMGKRNDNNTWCIPGGSLEPEDSSIEECASRELWEEVGIRCKPENMILNAAKFIQDPIIKDWKSIRIVSVSYIASEYDDTDMNINSREFTQYGWFSKEEVMKLKELITPYTYEGLKEYFKI